MKSSSRIILNTLFLYAGMTVTVCVSLFSTRWVLEALGNTDYGIYSLMANVVAMFSFLNIAMAAATQRYLSFAMGEGKEKRVRETFYYSAVMHLVIAAVVFCFLEFGGHWLVRYVLDIPAERLSVAENLLHFVAGSCIFTIIAVPYEGMLNARENMGIIALINIIDSLLKFATAAFLLHAKSDRLLLYGFLLMCVCACTFLMKYICCRCNYPEVAFRFHPVKDWKLFRNMLSFASWNLIGTSCGVARNQGVAVLINLFWGVVTNAAYGLSQQVYGMLTFFSNTIVRAVRPQIVKSEGAGNRERMLRLSVTTCKITFLMMALLAIPLYIKLPFILKLWLDVYPDNTLMFCRGFLLVTLIYQLTIGLQIAVESTGRIRLLQMVVGSMHILALPAGYVCFSLGFPVRSIMACIIAEECISLLLRLFIARHLTGLQVSRFLFRLLIPAISIVFASYLLTKCCVFSFTSDWASLFAAFSCNTLILCLLSHLYLLSTEERNIIKGLFVALKSKLAL